jgi:hypothetical protein
VEEEGNKASILFFLIIKIIKKKDEGKGLSTPILERWKGRRCRLA